MKRVGIIGYGYIGKALASFFEGKFEVVIYDPFVGFTDRAAVESADIAMVCVPTNMLPSGEADLSAVEETFSWLKTPAIVLRSTVPPGTTKKLAAQYGIENKLVFSPEFIGEGGYPVPHWDGVPHATDMKLQQFQIFGGTQEAIEKVVPFFQRVGGPFIKYLLTDSTTAELTKYADNAFIATKVSFCNELYDIAKTFGVNYDELRELWLNDGRIGRSHTIVYPDKRGFDGKCIPKDTNALYKAAQRAGYESDFLREMLTQNKKRLDGNKK